MTTPLEVAEAFVAAINSGEVNRLVRLMTPDHMFVDADGSTFVQNGELRPENRWSVPAAWRVLGDSDLVAVWQLYANQHSMHEILQRISAA